MARYAKAKTCQQDGCQRPVQSLAYCATHYERLRSGRDMTVPIRRKTFCKASGCDRPSHSKGYCGTHYSRFKNGLNVDEPIVPRRKAKGEICREDRCGRLVNSLGWCNVHYLRNRRGQPMNAPIRVTRREVGACSWHDCSRPLRTGGLCRLHYGRKLNGTDMDAPVKKRAKAKSRNGLDRVVNHHGYVEIRRPGHFGKGLAGKNVWFLEHRYVMETYLGRRLHDGENVHHINGDKADNRLENLELWTSQQPYGQRVVDLLAWAYSLRECYKNDRGKLLNKQLPMFDVR